MPLPDKHADEAGVEIPADLWGQYVQYRSNAVQWQKMADAIKAKIMEALGNAHAALVAGQTVATYRPTSRYAEARIMADYPDLARHYTHEVTRDVLDIELFAKAHPEIAEQYRVRSFVLKED
jgi:hypothetical protein